MVVASFIGGGRSTQRKPPTWKTTLYKENNAIQGKQRYSRKTTLLNNKHFWGE
jgi:hypothetical protein